MCNDLETSRVRLFVKHAAPSTVQNRLEKESPCIRIISESMLNHFSIRDASVSSG